MDERKFEIIIHATDAAACSRLIQSLETVNVPENFDAEIQPVTGDEKYFAYDTAMRSSDAKYKIYIDEHAIITDENFLIELLKIFRDESIVAVGTSGAVELSTHGISLNSAKRTDKNFRGEVEIADGFFFATQYDLPWRHDLFADNFFGGQAQCVEFKRAGYKIFVGGEWIDYRGENFTLDETSRQKFLDEYSTDLFPLVSIIIPTFNRPKYFRIALESALNQTYRNIEVVISDDSTIDDTEHLIQDYLARDKRITYFRNKGFTADDNWKFLRAYNNPAAEYVNWLMDDDLFYPTKIEKMVEVYRNNPDVSLVTSSRDVLDEEGNIRGKIQKPFEHDVKISGNDAGKMLFLLNNYIGEPTTVLIRKKFLRDNDLCWNADETGFFPLIDVSTWLQLLTQGNMVRLIECLSGFRYHSKQASYWIDIYSLSPVAGAKLLRTAWNKKIFLTNESDFRKVVAQTISIAAERLEKIYDEQMYSKEVELLEKTLAALAQSLINGYKLELPTD